MLDRSLVDHESQMAGFFLGPDFPPFFVEYANKIRHGLELASDGASWQRVSVQLETRLENALCPPTQRQQPVLEADPW